jgi:adenine/guanine phosphoribosyltransferase-like PRPP-binding protein
MHEIEWRELFYAKLDDVSYMEFDYVTGPGRSGAIASVYASHYLGIPFKPHKAGKVNAGDKVLIVDTVEYTGSTLRKSKSWHENQGASCTVVFAIKESRGHYFKMWYEKNPA